MSDDVPEEIKILGLYEPLSERSLSVPVESIERMTILLGDCCRVVSETTATERTLTIMTPEGHICTFKGQMEFTWVVAP